MHCRCADTGGGNRLWPIIPGSPVSLSFVDITNKKRSRKNSLCWCCFSPGTNPSTYFGLLHTERWLLNTITNKYLFFKILLFAIFMSLVYMYMAGGVGHTQWCFLDLLLVLCQGHFSPGATQGDYTVLVFELGWTIHKASIITFVISIWPCTFLYLRNVFWKYSLYGISY